MVLAETAASLHACWDLDLSRSVPVGIEISGSHIRPAADGHILARASVVRRSFKLASTRLKSCTKSLVRCFASHG